MRKKLLLCVLLLIALAAILIYYFWETKKKHEALVIYGNVDVRQVDLGFRVSGRVTQLMFEEGDLVKPGQLVAVLDKQPYTDQVKEAQAAIESTRKSLVNAEINLKRRKELIGDGGVSQEDLDTALTNREVLAANLKQAEASLGVAQTNLRETDIYAPIEGTILSRIREPGTVVNVADPVYTLSILSPVWVRAFISEEFLGVVYPGMQADIYTDTPNGKVYKGSVGFISPVAEFTPKTVETTQLRTDLVYRLRIYAENPDFGLRQGMPVTVKLPLPKNEGREKK